MCFSASASFIAGTSLSAVGVAALKSTEAKTERPFAMIPLLFGVQQLIEGVIWLTFNYDAPLLKHTMTYLYSGFSHVLWPMYMPGRSGVAQFLPGPREISRHRQGGHEGSGPACLDAN